MKKLLIIIFTHLLINAYSQSKKSEELYEKSKELFIAENYLQSIDFINEAIKLSPKWSKAYNSRGAIYIQLKRNDLAMLDLNKAIELEPNEKAYINRGIANENLLNNDAALKDYAKALELNPNFDRAFYQISLLKFDLQDYYGANQAIEKAIAIKQDPDYLKLQNKIKKSAMSSVASTNNSTTNTEGKKTQEAARDNTENTDKIEVNNIAKDKSTLGAVDTSTTTTEDKKTQEATQDNTNEKDKTVTLTVSGQGKTQDEARQKALRSAIEQAFGTFISTKTEILNDNLIKDEIVSVSNGNIQKFDVLSEVQIPDGSYTSTLKATVSVTKLSSFCESKGVAVEFKGGLFAMNIKLQKLNEEAENNAIINLCNVSKEILSKSIDYSLIVSEPQAYAGESSNPLPPDMFLVNFEVTCKANANYLIFEENFWQTVSGLRMSEDDISNYKKVNKPICYIIKYSGTLPSYHDSIPLRSSKSITTLKNLFFKSNNHLLDFRIISEIDTLFVKRCCVYIGVNDRSRESNTNKSYKGDNKWDLNFQHGYPASAVTKKNNYRYYNFRDALNISSGTSYRRYINIIYENTINEQLFHDSDIVLRGEQNTYETRTYFYGEENSAVNHIFVFKLPNQYSFKHTYRHILPLNKLEKISKYYIQPWTNNN